MVYISLISVRDAQAFRSIFAATLMVNQQYVVVVASQFLFLLRAVDFCDSAIVAHPFIVMDRYWWLPSFNLAVYLDAKTRMNFYSTAE
mmetsp:Transcript_52258/g.135480  ORF Transcript_52258/g.135480 Transcript_52258/m.135480 type:complete len:88 (+) Transcript_52258:77-340(+)